MKYVGTVIYSDSLEGGFMCLVDDNSIRYHLVDEAGLLTGLNSGDRVEVEADLVEGFGFVMVEGGMLNVSTIKLIDS